MNHPKVRKAVIAAAGFGTRFLPTTKTIPKEMLPIGDKPIIQHIVEELTASGIEEIILVTNWQKTSLEDHFAPSFELEHHLLTQGKKTLVAEIKKIGQLAKFVYVRQVEGYGNALPLVTTQDLIGEEPFIYVFPDDLVQSKVPFTKQLIDTYQKTGQSVIGVQEVDSKEVSKYGIVKLSAGGHIVDIVEKPTVKESPSRLAVFGRYLFTPEIFTAIGKIKKGKDNEYWLADAIKLLSLTSAITARPVQGGRWLTTGDPASYLEAILEYSHAHPELKSVLKNYVKKHS